MIYKVKLDIFEGPFDLLVYLIENAEMSIYDIRIAEITNQFIEHVERIKKIDAVLAGEFMVLAASLIEIKSKMLLPGISDDDGMELTEDPRRELVEKLLEYKKYKKAAAFFEEREERSQRIYVKPQEDLTNAILEPDIYLNLELGSFVKAFQLFLHKKRRLEEVHKRYNLIRLQQMTVESRIEQIKHILKGKTRIRFKDLLNDDGTRQNIVLTFLSMLELIRQRSIKVSQNVNFGEITLTVIRQDIKEHKGI